jgi:hypothetical protein
VPELSVAGVQEISMELEVILSAVILLPDGQIGGLVFVTADTGQATAGERIINKESRQRTESNLNHL